MRNFKIIFIFLTLLCSLQLAEAQTSVYQKTKQILNNPKSADQALVAAHRGDWRNAPENSIQSLENAIAIGAHIYELDVQLSKDSVLYLMHDKTIDRTTNMKGKVSDYTCAELKTFRLRNGLGRVTAHTIPSLEEFMRSSKGRIFLNIDKGFQHLQLVVQLIQKLQMQDEVYISIDAGNSLQDLEQKFGKFPVDIKLMPIININKDGYKELVESYFSRKSTMFQAVFQQENEEAFDYLKQVRDKGYLLWYNSLWASLCAGRDDDRAVEQNQPDETWGWLIKKGAHVIQSDRPITLLHYIEDL
ncbi:glycerophosphodiester phosphodiesterase family protein [Sphingobacterium composti Ten et al. 2007 non Yoo et al. 2007]|uniref:glycerophosphodiester phosphodiesterase family protein n=1 Tax=Sphingobacterium composti TaxID=363260 RepID=UPI0013598DC0|nr:glycerophosphodiester phosphodiesterase family protein [Sphingobacterium composti Ten et al. 2007 non Yoo et al. 2007]